ncbi:MAG: DUF1189 domain-containing protein [Kiritimatiellales bacterium]|nr:DUF1189 domain-containing protein [Kiritimatiellales bacterium]MCF7863466.1 DUF1189 domain-containing protein [Kiritimatiellales bacterium]
MLNKKYSIMHLPLMAFFSQRIYRDVGWSWKGANLAYLFVLLAVCWIPPTLNLREKLLNSLESSQVSLINQLPDIQISNGRVILDQQKPYYIKKANGTPIAIIDTTGSMNFIDDDNVMALLTETELIVRRGGNQFNTLDLSQISDFHINKFILNNWLQVAKGAIAPLSYGIFLLLSYIFTVLVLLLLAIIGLIVSAAAHSALRFSAILRMAAVAATPAIILISISAAFEIAIPGTIYTAVTLLYLFAGIKACRQQPEEETVPRLNLVAALDEEAA